MPERPLVMGTRPEVIELAPVLRRLALAMEVSVTKKAAGSPAIPPPLRQIVKVPESSNGDRALLALKDRAVPTAL